MTDLESSGSKNPKRGKYDKDEDRSGKPTCSNPYSLHEKVVFKYLRIIKESDLQRNPNLKIGSFWCDNCRKTNPQNVLPSSSSGKSVQLQVNESVCSTVQVTSEVPKSSHEGLGRRSMASSTRQAKSHKTPAETASKGLCCNPFQFHAAGTVSKGLRQISSADVARVPSLKIGELWCGSCRKLQNPEEFMPETPDYNVDLASMFGELNEDLTVKTGSEPMNLGSFSQASGSSDSSNLSPTVRRESVSHSLKTVMKSPLVIAHKTSAACVRYGKRKLEEATEIVRKKLCVLLNLPSELLCSTEQQKANDLDLLLNDVKEKLPSANKTEKYQLLSLCPLSWSETAAASFFGVGRKLVHSARELRMKYGILAVPTFNRQPRLPEVTKEVVRKYYCSDENSKVMPGLKDSVSVGLRVHEQRRLLLFNLKELYEAFKENVVKDNPSLKVGFSIFCSLRPKCCTFAGAAGTHTVCVCQIHQNLKLILYALRIKIHYRQLISKFVCNVDNRSCMLLLCDVCYSMEQIQEALHEEVLKQLEVKDAAGNVESVSEDDKLDFLNEDVKFRQWKSTDQSELVTQVCKRFEVLEILVRQFKILIPHDFIARNQATYVKKMKESLPSSKAIVMMDFSMNYSCVIQYEVQSHHWTKKQVTLHPCVIYYKTPEGAVVHKTIMCISDDLDHDVALVKKFQERTINYLNRELPHIVEIEYVSDGCGAQYKNKMSFKNLCNHEKDFGKKASHSFFATSHGKSQCDGDAGTVKRYLVRRALQRTDDDQITDAEKVYELCVKELSSTYHFEFVRKSEVDPERKKIKKDELIAVPGTRSFHYYEPISDNKIGCKRISSDENFSLIHCLDKQKQYSQPLELSNGDFVLARIVGKRFIAFITDLNVEEGEADVTLLWPQLPSREFSWPKEIKTAVVPMPHIVCKLSLHELPDNKYCLTNDDKALLIQLKVVRKF